MCLMLSTLNVFSQNVQGYKATGFAYKLQGYEWSDWSKCSINIEIDLSKDIVVIYSKDTQIYKVLDSLPAPYDDSGQQVAFKVIDQDYDIGKLRLRIENNGNSQIYIDFNDISWVYNVIRTY